MKIISKPCLDKLTTIGIRAYCEGLIQVKSLKHMEEVTKFLEKEDLKAVILGRGSNVVPSSGYIPCFLIKIEDNNDFKVIREDRERVWVSAGGGASLRKLIMWCVKKGYTGLEGLAGIPGTVGGAVAMNAGSFGVEISDLIYSVCLWHIEDGVLELKAEELNFSYRKFSPPFKRGLWCVLSVELGLKKSQSKLVKSKVKKNYLKKKQSQPVTSRTCGCVFKNHFKYPAGYLLERSGMKGFFIGGVKFSDLHANFLINHNSGTPSQAMELIEIARDKVFKKFDIDLELEVKILS